jgi:NB-ARC domain/CHAT domain
MSSLLETFELYLSHIDDGDSKRFKVIVTKSTGDKVEVDTSLPFFEGNKDWRTTLIKVLEATRFNKDDFQESEQGWMIKSGILLADRSAFDPDYLKNIGQLLYRSLFPDNSRVKESLKIVEEKGVQLHIKLEFQADVVKRSRLPDYPWELLHDGEKFLLHRNVTLSRYIAHNSVSPNLPRVERIDVLLISSAASDESKGLNRLSSREKQAVRKGLEQAEQDGHITLAELEYPTFDCLREYLTEHSPHVLHFDGHGVFGILCQNSKCRTIYPINLDEETETNKICEDCDGPLPKPQGYLVFEDENGHPNYISAEEFGSLLQQSGLSDGSQESRKVALVVLTACQSAMALVGDSVFNGTAQNLISHQIPAVVAMQYSVNVSAATKFAKQFYSSLGQKNSLSLGISKAREAMGVEGDQWYRPVLYLRWRDNEGGQLFAVPSKSLTRIGISHQVPPLPTYYVDRPEYSQDLKNRLLKGSSSNGTLVITAIHGMGSVGKSTMAAAIAHDPGVKNHFCDGILWATLGQEPNVLSLLSGWVQALGDYNFSATDKEATSAHLRTLVHDKTVLLVVDDAWNPADVQHFKVGGSRCQMLVTTREAAIAVVLGVKPYPLDVMKPEQAIELLTRKLRELGHELNDIERQPAANLALSVGYLPLALELAAVQVAGDTSWERLLQDIKQEIARLKFFEQTGGSETGTDEASLKRLSLTASLNLSIKRLPEEYKQNFTWLGVLPEDVTITPAMTATLWDIDDERDAADTLKDLRDKALLLPDVSLADGTLTYRLHDLLHDLARNLLTSPSKSKRPGDLPGLGFKLVDAHTIFLKKYQQKTKDGLWHSLPNDAYIHQHLVWHLEKANQIEEIHQLLREESETGRNGWYEARERLAQTVGYLNDVSHAWELAEASSTEATLSKIVGLQFRYALITASVNSLAANLPGNLLVVLVKKKVWSSEQGLAYLRRNPDLQQRVKLLIELSDYLPLVLKEQALKPALDTTKEIQNEEYRAQILCALADKLPLNLLPQAFDATKEIQNEEYRTQILCVLANKLPPNLLPQVFDATRKIQNWEYRAQVLCALGDKLPPNLIPQVFDATREILNELIKTIQSDKYLEHSVEIFIVLVENLSTNLLPDLLSEVLDAARKSWNKNEKYDEKYYAQVLSVLIVLVDNLQTNLLLKIFLAAREIQSERYRAQVLCALADKLATNLLSEAFSTATNIQNEQYRAQVLCALANKLPSDLYLFSKALDIAKRIQNQKYRAQVLCALANKLPPNLLPQAFDAAKKIWNEKYYAQVLCALADKLPPDLLSEALDAAEEIQSWEYYTQVLCALADKLPPNLLPQVFDAARKIWNEEYRVQVLISLVGKLPIAFSETLKLARTIGNQKYRAQVLSVLADKLSPDLFYEFIEATREIWNEEYRIQVLKALADKLPTNLLSEVLKAAREIQIEEYRAQVLSVLIHKLSPDLLSTVLDAAREIQIEEYRAQVLSVLTHKLSPDLLSKVLDAAREIQIEEYRAQVLSALIHKLPLNLLHQALQIVKEIQDEKFRAQILSALAGKLSTNLLPEVLNATREIEDKEYRAQLLNDLADKLPTNFLGEVLKIAMAIQDESEHAQVLSALADKLPTNLLSEALNTARNIQNEEYRAQVLCALIYKLPPNLLHQALQIVREIQGEEFRDQVLNILIYKLPENLLSEALQMSQKILIQKCRVQLFNVLINELSIDLLLQILQAVMQFEDEEYRIQVLSTLTNKLPEYLLPQALQVARKIWIQKYRTQVMNIIIEKLPENLLSEALDAARNIQDEEYRAQVLCVLADKLPEHLLSETLDAARNIQDEEYRAQVLCVLADKLPEILLLEALDALRDIQNEEYRAQVLCVLADKLPEILLSEALDVTRNIQDEKYRLQLLFILGDKSIAFSEALKAAKAIWNEEYRAQVLCALVHKMPTVSPEIIQATQEIFIPEYRAQVLIALADKLLDEDVLSEVFDAAKVIQNEEYRAQVLSALANKLTPNLLSLALESAMDLQNDEYRNKVLSDLAFHLSVIKVRFLWQNTLHTLSQNSRPYFLQNIKALVPVIFTLGGYETITEVFNAIQDVTRWWK